MVPADVTWPLYVLFVPKKKEKLAERRILSAEGVPEGTDWL